MPFTGAMTAFLPLDTAKSVPSSPAFLVPSPNLTTHVKRVITTILDARRVVIVCGAGVSVQAGIPDFRSSTGLFQTLKKKNHTTVTSGKDLFDASVFNSKNTTSLFYQMIARLSQLSEAAEPTPFHHFLRVLDDRRRLLRVYTQNIDALEEKSGLTFGVPAFTPQLAKHRSSHGRSTPDSPVHPVETSPSSMGRHDDPSARRLLSPLTGMIPKCIPLHGTLQLMHCVACRQSYPLCNYIDFLISGTPPPCPECAALEETRRLVGKRSHGVGKLRPSIVLYNEEHKSGEAVGDMVLQDLMGRADLLMVVGTSLRVPGTKRIVREFSKAVRSRWQHFSTNSEPTMDATSSAHKRLGSGEDWPARTIYVNLDFPVPTREWEGVFDVWVQGDAQVFATMVHEELEKREQVTEAVKRNM